MIIYFSIAAIPIWSECAFTKISSRIHETIERRINSMQTRLLELKEAHLSIDDY